MEFLIFEIAIYYYFYFKNNLNWPYQIIVGENDTNACYDQIVTVSNVDTRLYPVFYYLIPMSKLVFFVLSRFRFRSNSLFSNFLSLKANSQNNLFDKFVLNPLNGQICSSNKISSLQLVKEIIGSKLRYIDELDNVCVNLFVFASKRELCAADLASLRFDVQNCSFNLIKICVEKVNFNLYPPEFNKTIQCEASKNYLSKKEYFII
jgi:hypothetical protein